MKFCKIVVHFDIVMNLFKSCRLVGSLELGVQMLAPNLMSNGE